MPDDHTALTALATHLANHPLTGTVLTVALPTERDPAVRIRLRETPGADGAATDWASLHTWADTIGSRQVTVTPEPFNTTYTCTGHLDDGTPVEVCATRHDQQQHSTVIPLDGVHLPTALHQAFPEGAA